ncbi:iron-binding protein [Cellulomonas bogoriensis 69B4 = DSM 16987]|uniref:Iron-binding protein n=1 Tax=Cellulomonas bogoriensis 69B4 = DSM 16987 TaxID=1386082 RepID=A0A0A0BYZ5_9CELL|nr:iron-binding protein [Cellulomonas bogoriensis 69B4 = DSM 16987]
MAGLVAGLLVTGCGVPQPQVSGGAATDEGRPTVLATFSVLADIASVVAGPDAVVESLTPVGTEIHGYEPTPSDIRLADGADVLLANGLGLEDWLVRLVEPSSVPTVVLGEGVDPVPVGGPDGPTNPHAWMSAQVGAQYVEQVVEVLAELDPPRAEAYEQRGAAYAAELRDLHQDLLTRLSTVPPEHRVLVTCEGAFSYLTRDAGLDEVYLWPVNAEREGTPQQVAEVVRTVRDREVPAVFCESTVSSAAQEQVARESGARFAGVLYVDSLSGPDGPVPTYLDLLSYDVDLIVTGLGGHQGAG